MFYEGQSTYYYFKNAIPIEKCDEILAHFKKRKPREALVGNLNKSPTTTKDKKFLAKIRNSSVVFDNPDWIYGLINPLFAEANRGANWNLEHDYNEAFQFTIYKKNQFYTWHSDTGKIYYDNPDPNFRGKTRKITAVTILSNPGEFSGGNLQFKVLESDKVITYTPKEVGTKGSVIVFPSHTLHRVTPVTKGVRYSLVLWSCGLPLR
jgi:PKHD-type hydroxylase|tara:strand:+ start:674 stop:1294 length:621 start_codon:yes stop_codon:yes gene_type:complete